MRISQRGVTLIELILAIGLMAFITMLSFYEKQTDLEQAKARAVGGHIFQYNNAVRNALAQKPPTSTATYAGTGWLKSSSCGGMLPPDHEFLPCDFPAATPTNPIPFGQVSFTTTVVAITGTAPFQKFVATTSTSAFTVEGRVRADLSGIAVLSAASAMNSGVQAAAGGGLSPIAGATDSRFSSNALTGVMTFVASNTASNDVWLRTDGSNSMHKPLVFDATDFADRQIIGASRIQNIAGQALFLGSGSGLTAVTGAGVVVDSSAEVLGAFRVRDSLVVDGAATVAGNLSVNGEVAAAGSISSKGNVTADGALVSQIFYDANNMGYYVDPHATSNINTLVAAGNVTANGALVSPIFYDANNMGYYVDPDATSNLNSLAANYLQSNGRIRGGEFLDLAGVANAGDGCGPNGLVGHDASGGLLSCTNGVWSAPGVSVASPVTIVNIGPMRGTWSGCWTTVRPALITASGPGATVLTVNGVTISTTMGWGGEFSDIGMDFAISGLVPAGGSYCYYVTNNRKYSTSSGIRVMSSSL
jgi:type II secretory pathway pseudopilin PulG